MAAMFTIGTTVFFVNDDLVVISSVSVCGVVCMAVFLFNMT